jgi:hypothetical protein
VQWSGRLRDNREQKEKPLFAPFPHVQGFWTPRSHLAATEAIAFTTLRINRIFLESEPFFTPFGSFSAVCPKLFFKMPTSRIQFSIARASPAAASSKNHRTQIVTTVGMTFSQICDSIALKTLAQNPNIETTRIKPSLVACHCVFASLR